MKIALAKQVTRYLLDLGIVRPKDSRLGRTFLYEMLLTDAFHGHVRGYTNGSTVLHLGKNGLPSFEFCLPTERVMRAFEQLAAPLFQESTNNHVESDTLAAIRDALLPRLLSGELGVEDLEQLRETLG